MLMSHVYEGAAARGHKVFPYYGHDDCLLITYGLGGADRLPIANRHRANGEKFVAFDAGYWGRSNPVLDRPYRLAINGFHPQADVMRGPYPGSERWAQSGLKMRATGNSRGPILLVGNAPKSIRIGAAGWSQAKLAEIRKAFPGRKVLYRPKPKRPVEPVKADGLATGDIEDVLAGAALVVCRHSNVAVDACRLGVPVVCDDGAASAIYPNDLEQWEAQPSIDRRAEFLHRLAWWQWSMTEAKTPKFWEWLECWL